MDNIWFCKLLLLSKIESKTDVGMQKHKCAFVSVMEEYNCDRKPGVYITYCTYNIYITYDTYTRMVFHFFVIYISNHCAYAFLRQLGWTNVIPPSFMRGKCSLKCFMSSQSHRFWADCLLCLWGRLAPFRIPCARKGIPSLGHPATQRRMLLTAADGGTSTPGP